MLYFWSGRHCCNCISIFTWTCRKAYLLKKLYWGGSPIFRNVRNEDLQSLHNRNCLSFFVCFSTQRAISTYCSQYRECQSYFKVEALSCSRTEDTTKRTDEVARPTALYIALDLSLIHNVSFTPTEITECCGMGGSP